MSSSESESADEPDELQYLDENNEIEQNGVLINEIQCKKCEKNYSLKSHHSIRHHYDHHNSINEKKKDEIITNALGVISLDGQPFSFIDRIGTRKFIQSCVEIGRVDKEWTVDDLPSEIYLRRKMLLQAEQLKNGAEFTHFIEQMRKNGGCISYDMGDHNGHHFWTIFAHILTDSFEPMTTMLIFEEYTAETNTDSIRRAIIQHLAQFGFNEAEFNKIFHVTDGATNMRVAPEERHIICMCHMLDRILEHTTQPYADSDLRPMQRDTINKMNRLLGDLRTFINQINMSRLGRLLKLKAPSRVRFYTHVTMVMSFMEGYARIQQLVDGIAYLEEPFNDLNEDLNYFEAYIKTVEPLIKWIEKLEARNRPTSPEILPALAEIEAGWIDQLQGDGTAIERNLAAAALDALDWNINEEKGNKVNKNFIMAAAALDPSNWELFSTISDDVERWAEDEIINALCTALEEYAEQVGENENQQPRNRTKFARFQQPRNEAVDYVQLYIAHAKALRCEDDFNVLAYWKNEGATYPPLQRLAKLILSVPAGNIECERCFSVHRWMKGSERRASLSNAQTSAILMNRTPLRNRTNTQ